MLERPLITIRDMQRYLKRLVSAVGEVGEEDPRSGLREGERWTFMWA